MRDATWKRCSPPVVSAPVKIGKPLLMATTPVGLAIGLYEGWRLVGGLVVLVAVMILGLGVAIASVVMTIRREQAEEDKKSAA